jgi:hypothetical protein
MMLGELEYIANYVEPYEDDDPNTMPFGLLTYLFLIIFVLLMPILLMNLLVSHFIHPFCKSYYTVSLQIGLAVGDIESVQQNARLKRLAMQVKVHRTHRVPMQDIRVAEARPSGNEDDPFIARRSPS